MVYDVIIIGKGPAGITAGIYLKRANQNSNYWKRRWCVRENQSD